MAGCSSPFDDTTRGGGRVLEFTTFYTGGDGGLMQTIVDRYNASQDDVTLRFTAPAYGGDYLTKVLLVFLGAWNDFLWPLISTSSPGMQTLPLALVTFRSAYGDIDYGVVMASTVLAVTPPLLVFLFAQRFIIQGISSTGLKG